MTLPELTVHVLPNFIQPVPSKETLRSWFDRARVPRIKNNPGARRGGGPTYYSVSHIEKLLRGQALPGRITTGPKGGVS